ncbi:MAG: enoyl-CoA hydratase/isomerase family protein [Bacillota bacterium]
MKNWEKVLLEIEGNVATVVINRPEKRNSLSTSLAGELVEVFDYLNGKKEIRAMVIHGAGDKAFCSGFDISEIPAGKADGFESRGNSVVELAFLKLRNLPFPTIAMINGYAVGAGLELAVSCDFRYAADTAILGITPAKLGIVYLPHGLQRFIDLVGVAATRELFYTGRLISAARALEMHLVEQVVSMEQLSEVCYSLAKEIAGNAPLAVSGTKRIIHLLTEREALPEAEMQEAREIINRSYGSMDLVEGQRAFLEKRKPVFRGQ